MFQAKLSNLFRFSISKFGNSVPFLFQVQFAPFSYSVISALKTISSKIYVPEIKAWSFPLEDICTVEKVLQSLGDVSVEIEKISRHAVKVTWFFPILLLFVFVSTSNLFAFSSLFLSDIVNLW